VIKATVAVVVGFKLLTLLGRDVHEWAADLVHRHHFEILDRYVEPVLAKLIGVGDRQVKEISAAAFVYAAILYVEGIGLWFQKRWAEYLTVIATALAVPLEIYEIYEKPTWVRFAALAINIFVVWYLWTRLHDEKVEAKHRTFVKICGITNLDDARQAVSAGADAIGFNFFNGSKRYIAPERAKPIAAAVGKKVCKIGVFVNSPVEEVAEIFAGVGLDAVQLHGDEPAAYAASLREMLPDDAQIIVAIRSRDDDRELSAVADAFLVDTLYTGEFGGTGRVSDWSLARELTNDGRIVYLAGGLGPDNVADAVANVHPFAVDACSRLERSPGLKDANKVAEFVRLAKQTI
jgi:phosphoribosylanthranilate isomerase